MFLSFSDTIVHSLHIIFYKVGVTSPAECISPAKFLLLQRAPCNTDVLFLLEVHSRVGNAFEPYEIMQPLLVYAQCVASYTAVACGPVVLEGWQRIYIQS